jgi:subtilase family serine protease
MKVVGRLVALGAIGTLLAGCEAAGSMASPVSQQSQGAGFVPGHALFAPLGAHSIVPMRGAALRLCAASADAMHAACLSSVRMKNTRDSLESDLVSGLTPSDLASIYGYPAPTLQNATAAVVGIVVAYDYAGAESDLASYRAKYGLSACSTANGCFKKVGAAAATVVTVIAGNPTSISAHPTSSSSGWAAEADADTQAVSSVCGNCKIVLAEAASDSLSDLGVAVKAAVAAGATVVSASFGAPESASQAAYESSFEPAPVKVVAAAGDGGRGAYFPASATNVVAVAGTTLNTKGLVVTESLWSQSGGGCSTVFARPSYEPAWCGSKRSVADVAAVADPADGLAFYDSGLGGWGIVGGTSIAAPIVASMFALSGDTVPGGGAQELYAHSLLTYAPVLSAGNIAGLGAPLSLAAF